MTLTPVGVLGNNIFERPSANAYPIVSTNISGVSNENASQAMIKEPKDWPRRVNRGQDDAKTQGRVVRYRKVTVGAWSSILKRSWVYDGE